jgi:hypothetical protein
VAVAIRKVVMGYRLAIDLTTLEVKQDANRR